MNLLADPYACNLPPIFVHSSPLVMGSPILANVLDAVDGGLAGVLLGLLLDPVDLVLVVQGPEGRGVPGHHAGR